MTADPFDVTATSGGARTNEVLVAGMQLGKYKLHRVLGEGGMGVVWAAHDPDLERLVAIKVLRSAHAGAEQRARLLREARAMARLKHPNVLTVYEVDSDGDRDYIAMELVEGASLHAWLDTKPPYDEIWRAILAAGRGLAAAHAAGLVHRDFKPHNVLRSHDGRVLVTDFGLARGLVDDPTGALAITLPPKAPDAIDEPRKPDAVLDSTLTEPGAMMGTPAYMAPEQYLGAPPDPRTDQFAFCVTAWQALAGERPFRGTTIDELKRQCSQGVRGVDSSLPRAVRAVLARGLSPDPDERWPNLEALLDALDRASQLPRRRRAYAFAGFGVVMAGALLATQLHRGSARVTAPSACEPRDRAFADVWTTERRHAFDQRLAGAPNAAAIGDALDRFRDSWLDRYATACGAGSGAKATARISCLRGERGDVDGFIRLSETVPPRAMAGLELWGLIPSLEVCDSDSPVAPPLLPEDRVKREEIARLRAEVAKRRLDENDLLAHADDLLARARRTGWKPLVPELQTMLASAAQVVGDYGNARAWFEIAAEDAERLAAFKIEAMARLGLLEVELAATADATDPRRPQQLIERARGAVELAGNDPALVNALDNLIAELDVGRGKLTEGIDRFEASRTKLLAVRASRRAAVAMSREIDALEARDADGDLELAWQRGISTEHAIDATIPRDPLVGAMIELAWRRGDLDETHRRADKLEPPRGTGSIAVTGRVIGPDGAPAANARVVAWHGDLEGDGGRLYTRPDFDGAIATTDAAGAFTVQAPVNGAIVAELGDLRAVPIAITGKPLTLGLVPTHAVTGVVESPASPGGVDAFVMLAAAGARWIIRAPIARDRTFRIARVPRGAAIAGTTGTGVGREPKLVVAGPARDAMTMTWPAGVTIEVIVRTVADEVVVLRGRRAPASLGELARREDADADVATDPIEPIGLATATREGQPSYARDDRHAVVRDNAPGGEVTICAAATSALTCAVTRLPQSGTAVVILRPAR